MAIKQKVIDVSEHNGAIDWATVKKNGYHAIIRCGFGSDYANQDDAKWAYNVSQCEKLGIPYGVYIYSYATSEAQARSEAAHVKRLIKGHKPTYPIYWDSEEKGTGATAAKCWNAFKAAMGTGYELGIYASTSWWKQYLSGVKCEHKWVAEWHNGSSASMNCEMWQYSSDGSVSGVSSKRVDMNWCYVDFAPETAAKHTGTKYIVQRKVWKRTAHNLGKKYKKKLVEKGTAVWVTETYTAKSGNMWAKTEDGSWMLLRQKITRIYAKKA